MGEAQELPAAVNDLKAGVVENSPENAETNKKPSLKHYKWWLQMILYSLFVLAGQSVGTLLGRLYFDNGGKSQWMATLVQVVGFPIIPGRREQDVTKKKYVVGFLCTLGASAIYALMLSMTQLAFQKIIKRETIRSIVDMTIYQNLIATVVIVIGLFASGDWRRLEGEMREYKLGRVSYVMNLVWTAVSWQAYSVGCVGLVFKVSSLFSNVISIIGLPAAPVLAVVFLRDTMTGLKGVAMVLAVWGFVSYMYQHYLDDLKMEKISGSDDDEVGQVALVAERG
ncbi:hypothetical protein DH2020_042126 [Rehmannia glutinosa]|uniref:Uncharacterized protein n=1 Tax=Rehmannia glutinosa TaxID=99300 RepID=A0ABR0UNZ9_REHGL